MTFIILIFSRNHKCMAYVYLKRTNHGSYKHHTKALCTFPIVIKYVA